MRCSYAHISMRQRRPRALASALVGLLLLLPVLLSACDTTTATTPRPGTLRWRVQITDRQRATRVVLANGVVYLGGRDHTVYALDAATGAQRWRVPLGVDFDYVSAVADGLVYVMTLDYAGSGGHAGPYDGYVIDALDAATGAQRWQARPHEAPSIDAAVADGLVYFGAWSDPLFALDAATGTQRWQAQAGNNLYAAPAVANGLVYAISKEGNGSVVALDAATGEQRWQVQAGDYCCSALAVADGVVYVGTEDNFVYALDGHSGAQRWRVHAGTSNLSTPTVMDGVVYLGSFDHNVYALDAATGQLRWQFQTGDRIDWGPVVANGVVYVSATESDHNVYALDAATGKLRWRYQTGGAYFAPVVANGVAYVGSYDGFLYALNA